MSVPYPNLILSIKNLSYRIGEKPVAISFINPLTTNNDYSHHRNSTAWCQLAQSILKIGSAPEGRVGQGEVEQGQLKSIAIFAMVATLMVMLYQVKVGSYTAL